MTEYLIRLTCTCELVVHRLRFVYIPYVYMINVQFRRFVTALGECMTDTFTRPIILWPNKKGKKKCRVFLFRMYRLSLAEVGVVS